MLIDTDVLIWYMGGAMKKHIKSLKFQTFSSSLWLHIWKLFKD